MKDNIKTILDFFKLVKGNTKWIICLFIGSIVGHLTDLFIPIFASNIVLFITNANVLNEGKIVGMGTHEELLKSNSFYIDIQEHSYANYKK